MILKVPHVPLRSFRARETNEYAEDECGMGEPKGTLPGLLLVKSGCKIRTFYDMQIIYFVLVIF